MPASPSTARAINDRLALRLLQEGPLTAGQLKQLTGLSRPTVADLVERLAAAGLIAVVGEAGSSDVARTPGCTGSSPISRNWPRWTYVPKVCPWSSRICWARCWPRPRCRSGTRRAPGPPSSRRSPWSNVRPRRQGPTSCTRWGSVRPASSTPPPVNSAIPPDCPSGTGASSPPSTTGSRPASSSRTRRTSRPWQNSAPACPRPGHLRPPLARARHRRRRGPRRHPAQGRLRRHRRDRLPPGPGNRGAAVGDGLRRRLPLPRGGGGHRRTRRAVRGGGAPIASRAASGGPGAGGGRCCAA